MCQCMMRTEIVRRSTKYRGRGPTIVEEKMHLITKAKKMMLENEDYLTDARESAPYQNTVVGSVLSLTTHAPRWAAEQAVKYALVEIDQIRWPRWFQDE